MFLLSIQTSHDILIIWEVRMPKAVNPLIFGGFIKEAMRMKSFKMIRMVITIVDVVCLLAVLFVPALEAAKHNFFVWLILGLLTLYVLFMWLVLGRRNNSGYDAESDREADISKELLSQRNKWYM